MSHRQIIRISRPTKLELIRLRRRLSIARRIHRILRDRLTLLVQEFFIVIRRLYKVRKELNEILKDVYEGYITALQFYGYQNLNALSAPISRGVTVLAATRSVVGIRAPFIELRSVPEEINPMYPNDLVKLLKRRRDIIELIVRIAELERELLSIGIEFERTKRRVNMLEHILIPRLINTIRYLRMKFEEREREEKARLKRIKTLLARRRGV